MKKIVLIGLGAFLALNIIGCDDDNGKNPFVEEPPVSNEVNIVSQFVYDGMSLYYKWADEMVDKKPTKEDSDPKKYFKSLLSDSEPERPWSWITDDVEELLNSFSGIEKGFGYNLIFRMVDNKIYAVVKYVFDNTPAANAGIERLDFIGEVNGKPITANAKGYISSESIKELYGNNPTTFSLYKLEEGKIVAKKEVTVTPQENIKTNPILLDSVYTIGSKKIGYLFYNGFIHNYNEALYETFAKFKSKQVTDLVLDLRYNHGGAITSAVYLASMIAPKTAVSNKEILTTLDYNKLRNAYFDEKNWSRSDRLGEYDVRSFSNPLNANLNLNKVYIIATDDSFSASELTTFCLRSYMDVVHIGNKTGGKYTASITLHPYNERIGVAIYDEAKLTATSKTALKDWAMQPIVAKYTNKEGQTFEKTDGLIPDYELQEGNGYLSEWTALGDTKDVFLGKALYLITGDASYNPSAAVRTRAVESFSAKPVQHKVSTLDEMKKESVILDNAKFSSKKFREIMKLKK